MNIRPTLVITAFASLLSLASCCFAQDVHFTLVPPPPNEPPNFVSGMSQDSQGILWITGGGLRKYNGRQFKSYHHDPSNNNSLASDRAECVFADKDGIVWIGTFLGLDRLDPVTEKFTHYRHNTKVSSSIANDTVTAIIKDQEGTMWIGTNGGLERFDPATGKFFHHANNKKDPLSLSDNQVRIIYEDREGTIWVGCGSVFLSETPTGEGGLNKLNKKTGGFTRYLHNAKDPNSIIDNRIRAVFEDSRGTFWVGTAGDGLYTMDRAKGTFEHHAYDPAHPDKLSRPALKKTLTYADDHITFITEAVNGNIWIGTMQNGINVYDPHTQKITHYGAETKDKTGLRTDQLWYGYRTKDGLLWIGTWGNNDGVFDLYKINPYNNKLPYHYIGKQVGSFTEDSLKNLWIATGLGLALKDQHDSLKMFRLDEALYKPHNGINDIKKDNKKNKLWVSSSVGLFNFDPVTKSFVRYRHDKNNPNSLRSDSTSTTLEDTNGKLWIGTFKGLDLMDTRTGTVRHLQNHPADSSTTRNIVYSLFKENDGTLWAGTRGGISKFDGQGRRLKQYLPGLIVLAVREDRAGNIWAGTTAGFFKYNRANGNFEIFAIENGLLGNANTIISITTDQDDNLWLATAIGIIRLNVKNSQTNVYGQSQGVDAGTLNLFSFTAHDGQVFIADTSGYYAFYPREVLQSTPAPNVSVVNFSLGNVPVLPAAGGIISRPIAQTANIVLNHNQSTFSFGFENIDYAVDGQNGVLQYKLENYDGAWRKAGDDRVAYYFNIPPGQYVFKLQAINGNGATATKSITIVISPPWWQTWWAISLFVLFIVAAIRTYVYYRSQKLRRENRLLEEKIHLRTSQLSDANKELHEQQEEITAQRDELSRTVSDLKTTQHQLIQSEKMASMGELTAGIAHEIQNPLNFVNNFSEVNAELIDEMEQEIDKGNLTEAKSIAAGVKENQRKISIHGKRADAIVKNMLQHSRVSSGQKEPVDINALADEYLRLAYHGLRAKDKSFNAVPIAMGMITNFDEKLPKVTIVQQDIGRVLLNLFNNAFYAVNQKLKTADVDYKPEVSVTTTFENGQIIIKVKDNGNGIPDAIKDKIMQPFFTTKPTGEGTGLGLSLSYDIVVKGHGGNIVVNTKEGEGATFTITLPI